MLQLDRVSRGLVADSGQRETRLTAFVDAATRVDAPTAIAKTQYDPERPFLAAQVLDSLLGSYSPVEPPPDWCAVAVDGSHIDVDRHLPVGCYLINMGGCSLTYGSRPDAGFFSQPHLYHQPEDLYLADPSNPAHEEPVTGPLLGLMRTVQELERLAQAVAECPTGLATLAMVDGSLVLWPLSGRGYAPYVKEAIIQDRLLPALERLREESRHRPLCVAAYVSLPRSAEVVNAARSSLCPLDLAKCRGSCNNRRSVQTPCDLSNGFIDRDLFQRVLNPGWRSAIYLTNSSVPRESYGEHQVCFFYLNCGEEIGRVELPQWVAQDERLLSLCHSLVLDQCRRGQGYPVAISEAHEQAVISGADRQLFKQMVTEALEREGLPAYTSEKDRSKRTPWL